MKSFSKFIQEAETYLPEFKEVNLAKFHALRLGLTSDGKGGWYKDGEFVAKSIEQNGRVVLKFYNQDQKYGKKDPRQDRTKLSPLVPPSHQTSENINRDTEKELREKYISGEIFKENTFVENIKNGLIGRIIRRGTNYLICVTEDNIMFKPWIRDVKEWTNQSGVPSDQREVGTDSLRKYAMKMSNTKKIDNFNIKNFINKYKVKK